MIVKQGNATPEQIEILREIGKHPDGTAPGIIYKHFDSQTWEVLRRAERNNPEDFSSGQVFQLLCKLVTDPKIFEKVAESKKHKRVTSLPTNIPENELDQIIEDAIITMNEEIQSTIEDISQKVFNEVKNKINNAISNK